MGGVLGFFLFGLILAASVLGGIMWYNNRKDKGVENNLKEELDMFKNMGRKKGQTAEQSTKEYLETLKGGLMNNGRTTNGRTEESKLDRRTASKIAKPIEQSRDADKQDKQLIRDEERRDIQIEPNRELGDTQSGDAVTGNTVKIDWE